MVFRETEGKQKAPGKWNKKLLSQGKQIYIYIYIYIIHVYIYKHAHKCTSGVYMHIYLYEYLYAQFFIFLKWGKLMEAKVSGEGKKKMQKSPENRYLSVKYEQDNSKWEKYCR